MNSTEAPVPTHFLCSEEGALQTETNQITKEILTFFNYKI